jgi:hypothetical protein
MKKASCQNNEVNGREIFCFLSTQFRERRWCLCVDLTMKRQVRSYLNGGVLWYSATNQRKEILKMENKLSLKEPKNFTEIVMCNDCFINKFRDELLEQMKDYYQAFYEENYPNEIEDAVNKLSEDEVHCALHQFLEATQMLEDILCAMLEKREHEIQ